MVPEGGIEGFGVRAGRGSPQDNVWAMEWNNNHRIVQLQFALDDRWKHIIIKHIIRMNWSEVNPYMPFIFPFFDYSFAYELQKQAQSHMAGPFPLIDLDREFQNIKSYDTQAQLTVDKHEGRGGSEVRSRTIRKQKLLKKREREDNFERKKQKKDRNLPSNIFKYFASHLYSHPGVERTLETLDKANININPQLFISKLKGVIKQTQSYIRPAVIQSLCGVDILDTNESLAFRILLKRFLLLDLPVLISPMQKYKKRQRRELLNLGRKLFLQIKEKAFQ